jgi:hypothetical protein
MNKKIWDINFQHETLQKRKLGELLKAHKWMKMNLDNNFIKWLKIFLKTPLLKKGKGEVQEVLFDLYRKINFY